MSRIIIHRCRKCGGEIRLGVWKISVNRRRGVAHYLDHMNGSPTCDATKGFACSMFKPYPKRDEDKDWFQMIARWNAENPESGKDGK